MKTGVIYAHRNKINGKYYVGQTIQKNPAWRWNYGKGYGKSQSKFYNAIQKYGWENFEHIILEENVPEDLLEEREAYWIKYYKANDPKMGYNILSYGRNGVMSGEQRKIHTNKLLQWQLEHPEENQKRIKAMQQYWKEHPEEKAKVIKKAFLASQQYWKQHPEEKEEVMKKMRAKAKESVSKQVICIETQEVYFSAQEASLSIGMNRGSVSKACTGKVKTAGGYHWKYISREEYEEKCKSKKEME